MLSLESSKEYTRALEQKSWGLVLSQDSILHAWMQMDVKIFRLVSYSLFLHYLSPNGASGVMSDEAEAGAELSPAEENLCRQLDHEKKLWVQ